MIMSKAKAWEWWRGRDNFDRIHTFAVGADEVVHHLPDEGDTTVFGYSPLAMGSARGYAQAHHFEGPARDVSFRFPVAEFEQRTAQHGIEERVRSRFEPGTFYQRMWRPHECPGPADRMSVRLARVSTIRHSRILSGRFRELMNYIEPDRAHDEVCSHEVRQLLLLACMEVESAWRSVLVANGADKDARLTRWDYVRLGPAMRLGDWLVRLSAHPEYGAVAPFRDWTPRTPTLGWYDAYNDTKHDREGALQRATFGDLVNAMAAVFVMTVAQFGRDHLDEGAEMHADEFHVEGSPTFGLDELYIRPLRHPETGELLEWMEQNCPGLEAQEVPAQSPKKRRRSRRSER